MKECAECGTPLASDTLTCPMCGASEIKESVPPEETPTPVVYWQPDQQEHYTPEDPGSPPKPGRRTTLAVLAILGGPILAWALTHLGLDSTFAGLLGTGLFILGAWGLVNTLRTHREDPFDDGAQV